MTTSDQIHEIASALAKAQGEMDGASKSAANPFFKSKYADLASVWDACRGPLSSNGIAIIQSPSAEGVLVTVETLMVHTSGQWMRNVLTVPAKEDSPQAIGSAITYLRRYVLQSLVGVAPEDDDAEAAHGRGNGQTSQKQAAQMPAVGPKGYNDWLTDLEAAADEGEAALKSAWTASAIDRRDYITKHDADRWAKIKAKALKVPVSA